MNNDCTANILIVDDDLKSLTAMEALLAGPGREIIKAASGADALRCLLRRDFALILLDVRIPDMDGFETATLIRQRERSRYTPIIFISAMDTLESDVFRGVASGAVDYLFKPVVPQILQAKVSVFVDLFQMNERLKQQAVRQSEERFRLIVESLQDYAVFMMNPEGRVTLWNRGAEQMWGWKQDEVLGQSFARFYSAEDQAANQPDHTLPQTIAHGRHEEEGWRHRKDGSRFWANVVYTTVQDDNGDLIGFSAVTRDLTDRKRAEDELQRLNAEMQKHIAEQTEELIRTIAQRERLHEELLQAQKMESIGTLAGGIAHDFNNLLNVILGYASLLEQSATSNQISAGVDVIKETVTRGSSLVRQLLAVARKSETQFERTEINGLLQGLQALLQETFPKTIDVFVRLEPNLPALMADPNQIHQAMLNLCLNSRDAMPEGGELLLKTGTISGIDLRQHFQEARQAQYVRISVTDTGHGLDKAIKNRVFEPFFTTKSQGQGSGLGLSVVYGIVTNHNGFIDMASEPGHGTTFDIYLPVPSDAAATLIHSAAGDEEKKTEQTAGSGATILFVEDETHQLNLMQKHLAAEGYRVLTAKDGAEAVETYLRHKQEIDLVVLDLGLPKLNGWEAYKMMKGADSNVKAIFATGFISPEIEAHLETEDSSAVITKPYSPSEMGKKIATLLHKPINSPALASRMGENSDI